MSKENYLKGDNVALALNTIQSSNKEELLLAILVGENTSRPVIQNLQTHVQWLICALNLSCLLIGSYFKFFLYQEIRRQFKSKKSKPVNTLILTSSIIQHFTSLMISIALPYRVWNTNSPESSDHIGHPWIGRIIRIIFQFALYYPYIGSLGIATVRILYIKRSQWVKYRFGEVKLMRLILFGGIAIAIGFTFLLSTNDYEKVFGETFVVLQNDVTLRTLDEYEQGRGNDPILPYFRNVRIILGISATTMAMVEITIYAIFFHFLYKHNNTERLRSLLGHQNIRRRNKNNANQFLIQFCCFTFEFSISIIFILAYLTENNEAIVHCFWIVKTITFPCTSAIEVLMSSNLRARVSKH